MISSIIFPFFILQSVLLPFPLSSWALETATCIAPLGMESGAIGDNQIQASSSFEHASVGPHNARIRVDQNGGAWCPRNMIGKDGSEWIEIELNSVHVITATETMGRFGNGQGAEFAEAYLLEYYRPRLGKWVRYRNIENSEIMKGNTNTYIAIKEDLSPVILANKIRFHPYSPHQRTICMRIEAYGCTYDGGIISYAMPQGDKRGATYEFYDWNYDGEWSGDSLRNGLGSLTDGNLGPADYKLSYYAKNRGWVGWKAEKRDFVEIIFEFQEIQEFYNIEIYCNNQFTRDISVFKELKAYFSIGGEIYNADVVTYTPMTDEIFEEPRNISAKLHRRIGRFVKVELYFASKWLLISEVSFDSSLARGNYSVEVSEGEVRDIQQDSTGHQESRKQKVLPPPVKNSDDTAHMPIIVGALATVIILLAAIIFFIVSRSRRRKLGGGCPLPPEKIALNCNDSLQFSYDPLTLGGPGSDSGNSNSNGSRSGGSRKVPLLDNNFNNSHPGYGSPRSPRTSQGSRTGSCHASPVIRRATPQSTPRVGGTPKRRIISNPMSEPPLYMEPYQVMRYSPYVRCGPAGLAFSKETAILSDTSCGDYAVPMPAGEIAGRGGVQQFSDSDTSLDQNSDYVFLQGRPNPNDSAANSLRLLRAKVEREPVKQILPLSVQLRTKLSEGTFGTVHTAMVTVSGYGMQGDGEGRLCAVKYMTTGANDKERAEFMKEVQLLSGLEDENISRVLGIGTTSSPHFVVMEYLEHGDLTQFLQSHLPEDTPYLIPTTKTLSFPTLIYMAAQVASGMKYLESLNFVHRDLATRNCLVGKCYHIKICDFGSDCPTYKKDYVEMDDLLLVPLRWMAWESVIEHRYTTKSDVWSFGVCLWEILNFAGIRPYQDLSDSELLSALQTRSCPVLSTPRNCHRDLYDLMQECWNINESMRPTFREIHLFLQRKNLGYSPV